jgi:hypothetical protein
MYSPITGRRQAHIHYFETSWNLKESDCHVCMYIHVMYIHRSWLQTFPFVFINLPRLLVMLPSTYEGMSRVTRTGEFSPNGWLFALGSCMKIREVDHIFWPLYSAARYMHRFWQIVVWATFWVSFSHTHLVTLSQELLTEVDSCIIVGCQLLKNIFTLSA